MYVESFRVSGCLLDLCLTEDYIGFLAKKAKIK